MVENRRGELEWDNCICTALSSKLLLHGVFFNSTLKEEKHEVYIKVELHMLINSTVSAILQM